MKKLDENVSAKVPKLSPEEILKLHPAEYVKIIKKYPKLLNPTFEKGEPAHGVYHKIETTGPPVTAKRRPIIAQKFFLKPASLTIWLKMS